MKKICMLPILLLFVSCNQSLDKAPEKRFNALNALVTDLDYFTLQEEFKNSKNQLPKRDSLYFEAILSKPFNNPEKYNEAIDTFFKTQKEETSDSLEEKMWNTKFIAPNTLCFDVPRKIDF